MIFGSMAACVHVCVLGLSAQHYFRISWYPWKMHELIELWHQKQIPFSFLLSLALFLFSSHLFLPLLFFPPHYSLSDFSSEQILTK